MVIRSNERNIVGLAQVVCLLVHRTIFVSAQYNSHMAAVIKGGGGNWSTGIAGVDVTERALGPHEGLQVGPHKGL